MRAVRWILVASLLGGCLGQDAPSPTTGDSSGTEDGRLALTLAPGSATVENDTLTWTWTLTTREDTTFTHRGCPGELVSVWIDLGGDERVDLYEYGTEPIFSACALREMTLPAGTHTGDVQWNGEREGRAPEAHAGGRVPAGAYEVVARLGATDRDLEARATVTVR